MPSRVTQMRGFDGVRVIALESRRSVEMARLIESYGGVPRVAPSMREVPIEGIVRLRVQVAQWADEQPGTELSRLPIPV